MDEINDTDAAAAWDDATEQDTTGSGPRFPNIEVQLTGEDGNIFNVLGIVQREMRRAGVDQAEVSAFFDDVTSQHSYDAALAAVHRWVEVA